MSAPLVWFPVLLNANAEQRKRWDLIGSGEGIHWPDLDEDLSIAGLLRFLSRSALESAVRRAYSRAVCGSGGRATRLWLGDLSPDLFGGLQPKFDGSFGGLKRLTIRSAVGHATGQIRDGREYPFQRCLD
jgi:uncharacterized protein DUF2442